MELKEPILADGEIERELYSSSNNIRIIKKMNWIRRINILLIIKFKPC